MAERRRLTVMAATTSALLVGLSVCLLLITGGLGSDGWPVFSDDRGSVLHLPDPRASAGGAGSNGVVAAGTGLAGRVHRLATLPAPPGTAPGYLAPPRSPAATVPFPPLVALLPGLPLPTAPVLVPTPALPAPQSVDDPSARSPSPPESPAGRDRDRSREKHRSPREGPKVRTVAQTAQQPTSHGRTSATRVREGRGPERATTRDKRRSERPERRAERFDISAQRRPDRVERRSHRAEGRAGRPEVRPPRAEHRPAQADGVGRGAERADKRAERGRDRAERRDGR